MNKKAIQDYYPDEIKQGRREKKRMGFLPPFNLRKFYSLYNQFRAEIRPALI